MRFNRTEHYYNACREYRAALREIWASYDKEMQRIEQYRGSKGYEKEAAELESKRKEAVSALQAEYRGRFNNILEGMRQSATSRPMTAPTQEELALLQALKMREKVSRDELEQAARTLKDSPVSLSVLNEIAAKSEVLGVHFTNESTSSILEAVDGLAESAKRLCALDKCDSKQEQAARASKYSPDFKGVDAFYSFRVDTDFDNEAACIEFMGGVRNMQSFRDAVNE